MNLEEGPTDGQLLKMAKDACKMIENEISNQRVNKYKTPTVMTALAVVKQVFLASSMKGGQYVYEQHDADGTLTPDIANMPGGEPLRKALGDCMKQDGDLPPDRQHKNNAIVWKIMAHLVNS